MIVTSRGAHALGCVSGPWRIWSLEDGHVDMSAEFLIGQTGLPKRAGALVRLSVNCFLVEREGGDPGAGRVLIDCGAGGSWEPTMGHLGEAMIDAGIDPASIATLAATHTHLDHVNGLLAPGGEPAFPRLSRIVIGADAVASFREKPELASFHPLLAPVQDGDAIADHLRAVAMPGHAPGHMGYLLDTGDDRILFCGDIIHVPAQQFARPELTWRYDQNQSLARASRIKLLGAAAEAGTWLAGAHLGRPGIGRITREEQGYAFVPAA